jgi:hypothetical protein
MLTVGGQAVDFDRAQAWVQAYLNGAQGEFGYPSYDGYETNNEPDRLCDGDFLAPALLNVNVKIPSFADLQAMRHELEAVLVVIPSTMDLADAEMDVCQLVGNLYAILDPERRPRNVLGTTLAKVLHRKKPAIVPLYDRNVEKVYLESDGAPIPPATKRSWVDYMTLFTAAVRADLRAAPQEWSRLAALAPSGGPPVTRLRALDIVAWRLGATI